MLLVPKKSSIVVYCFLKYPKLLDALEELDGIIYL